MISLTGFFDGSTFVPLDEIKVEKNQKVIITILDDFIDTSKKSKNSYFGSLKNKIKTISEDFDKTPDCFEDYT
ncbi:MAG TPA: hypothetical protein DDW88_09075 [Treponema sp.]|jgi:hypothetical protein|nr:hypothetical protein [Treponema sp.]